MSPRGWKPKLRSVNRSAYPGQSRPVSIRIHVDIECRAQRGDECRPVLLIPFKEVSVKFDQLTKALAAAGMLVGALTSAYAVQEDPAAAAPAAVGTAGSNAVTVKLCPSGYFRVGTNLCM